jgi:hypothetical protein
MTLTVVSLFDRSGNMVRPWIEAGYRAITVDLQPAPEMAGRVHIRADVLGLDDEFAAQFSPAAVFAFPPCTDLAVSGARWFRDKGLAGLIGGLQLVEKARCICEASGAPWMIENPVSTLATYWRQPDVTFDPWEFAGWAPDPESEGYTKRTCLWTGGGFLPPEKRRVEPTLGSMMHRMPPSETRANDRAVTPLGFAYAVFHYSQRKAA